MVSHSLYIFWLCVSVPVWCRRKLLWWWLSKAFFSEFSSMLLLLCSSIITVVFAFQIDLQAVYSQGLSHPGSMRNGLNLKEWAFIQIGYWLATLISFVSLLNQVSISDEKHYSWVGVYLSAFVECRIPSSTVNSSL